MRADIHPKYHDCKVTCGCGNTFMTRATLKEMRIEICSVCHPFYSGKQKFVDTAGRVDKYVKKYGASKEAPAQGATK
ncbi:MAG: 50S ribosomal protein L31 [Planctomycetota bacterium]|nr:MAG: 50S ribosomal protein L31 [Planctomycetota bacterium]